MSARLVHFLLVVPAVLLAGWLVAGLPLLLAGQLHPLAATALAVAVTLPPLVVVARGTPTRAADLQVVPLLLTVAVAAGFAALAWTTSSEHTIVRRDPGVYAQTADWLADHADSSIPTRQEVFGDTPGLTYGSPGFYERGAHVVPQFMSGAPIALTPAGWLDGLRGITRADAVIGALALLAVAAFAARLAGPWAAPIAALALALVYPDLHQARSAFSEPAAQLLMFGGLALFVDAMRSRRDATSVAAVAGLLVGLVALVRIDALIDLVPLIPALAVLWCRGHRRVAVAAACGVAVGVALALVAGFVESRPYLSSLQDQLRLTLLAAVVVAIGTELGLLWRLRLARWALLRRRGPDVAAALFVAVTLVTYFLRPHLMHPRYAASDPAGHDIQVLQSQLGLPPDGPRTYAEQSMRWLGWWLGPTGLVLTFAALAVLLRRVLRGRSPAALPFVLVLLGTTAVVLARPSITPDHPWADRRFVPVVLPGLVVAGSWAVVTAARWVRARSTPRMAALVAMASCAALVVPALVASLPLLGHRTERGEIKAISTVCAALPDHAAVVVVGARARDEWPQVIRGSCNVPVGIAPFDAPLPVVIQASAAARSNDYTPVVLSDTEDAAVAAGGRGVHRVVHLLTREADHQLVSRPDDTRPLTIDVWLADTPA